MYFVCQELSNTIYGNKNCIIKGAFKHRLGAENEFTLYYGYL